MFLSPFHPANSAIWLYFGVQCADVIAARFENVIAVFLSCPPPPHLESAETVAASAAADSVNFEAMAAERNSCAEMQRLLGSSSLQLAFCQAGNRHFSPHCPTKIQNRHFFPFSQHFASGEARLPAYGVF
jgi:hypothetical protein